MASDDPQRQLESASFLQSVLEILPLFVCLLDDADCIRYINRVQPGFRLADVIGRPSYEFVAPQYHAMHREAIAKARAQGGQHSYLVQAAGAGGQFAHYETSVIGVDVPHGKRIVYLVAVEVTEHVARAEALRESEEKLRMTVEATGIGLLSWDLVSDAVEWDARLHDIIGRGKPVAGDAYIEECVHPDDRAMLRSARRAALHGSAGYPIHRIVRGDGQVRWVAPVGRLTRNERGEPVRLRGGVVDVTERMQTEEHLRKVQKLDALGTLTAGVAHNFNNALAVVLPAIETALADPSVHASPNTRALLGEAAGASQRAAQLVAQLMTSAGQRPDGAQEPLDLARLLAGVVSMCRQTFDRRYVIDLLIEKSPAWVIGDPAALEHVFLNLLLNARDALSARTTSPQIAVELREDELVRVVVSDNGPGMSDAVASRLFEPFFTTKPHGQGTGLGLATSRATVQAHGGKIEITSRAGAGTRCEITLPRATLAASERPREAAVAPGTAASSHILLVDDEQSIRSVTKHILEAEGHAVTLADSASQAVELAQQGARVDLVLLDCSMPGWPAARAVTELRARLRGTPILFFTGQHVSDADAALVEDVLLKPLSVAELHAAVQRWLPRVAG
jgi:PAS domain S-box-containing protein